MKNIISSDQGTYSCHVSNPKSAGAGTRTATLEVQGKLVTLWFILLDNNNNNFLVLREKRLYKIYIFIK